MVSYGTGLLGMDQVNGSGRMVCSDLQKQGEELIMSGHFAEDEVQFKITFREENPKTLGFTVEIQASPDYIQMSFDSAADEQLYGLGIQPSWPLGGSHADSEVIMLQQTYPAFISSHARGFCASSLSPLSQSTHLKKFTFSSE